MNWNNLQHGRYSKRLRRAAALPPDKAHIDRLVQRQVREIVRDLGGPEEVTAARRALLGGYATAMKLACLALDEALRRGSITDGADGWDLAPGLQRVKGLLDTCRSCLLAVGIERVPRDVGGDLLARLRRQAAGGPAEEPR